MIRASYVIWMSMHEMAGLSVFFLSLVIFSDKMSFINSNNLDRREDIKLEYLDHEKLAGRWYLYMDTRDADVRDNTYGDFDVLSDGKLVNPLYRWFPDLQECRNIILLFDPIGSNPETAVKFQVTLKSTNEIFGLQTFLYVNNHPALGFMVMHQQTPQGQDSYLVVTRRRDPPNLDDDIEAALVDLNLDHHNFIVKSTNYGCETKGERGRKL